ncbi:MAG: HAD hydrolase-like protein [Lachnospiraceae bacterium]|nr:HAD hydrolase-like protein [Lachnospiraceae bacterium]
MWKTILFDLDGTLTDSAAGIIHSVQYALHTIGIEEPDPEKLRGFVGPPLHQYFKEYANLDDETAARCVAAYRERYAGQGAMENKPYPSIPELLLMLRKQGFRLGCVTSKETGQARRVLEQFRLSGFFNAVVGCDARETNVSKEELILRAMRVMNVPYDRNNVVMVGDRFYDIEGAQAAGIASVGVLYGYGTREELEKSGATYIADNVGELGRILCGTGKAPWTNGPATFGRRIWNVVWPILLWILISNIVASIAGGIYGAIYGARLAMQDPSTWDVNGMVQDLYSVLLDYKVQMILSVIGNIVSIPIMWRIYKKDEKGRTNRLFTVRTDRKPGGVNAVLAVIMGFSVSAVLNILISITGIAEWMYEMNPSRYDMLDSLPLWAEFIAIVIFAPIAEELLFRGIIFRRVRDYSGYLMAAVLSAALFGSVHMDVVTGICAFIIGIIMAILYEYTGSLFTSMLFHAGFNFYSIAISLLPVESMSDELANGILIGLLAVCAIAAAVTFMAFLKRNKSNELG